MRRGFGFSGFGFNASNGLIAAAAAPVTDALGAALLALQTAGKLVSSWYLPQGNATQYLTLVGANVNLWSAAYGTQKVDLAVEVAAPQWDATLFSNKGGVTFDGTTQRLLGTGLVTNWPIDTDNLWMIVAVNRTGGAATRRAFGYGDTNSRYLGSTATPAAVAGYAGNLLVGATTYAGARTFGSNIIPAGTSTVYLDGVADNTAATASAALTNTRVRMGASTNTSASLFWQGTIACAAVLNSTATLADFTNLEALMRARIT